MYFALLNYFCLQMKIEESMGRLIYQTNCVPSNCTQTGNAGYAGYDLAGNLTSLTYPDGRVVSQTYNLGQLSGVTYTGWNGQSENVAYLSSTSYGPPGNLTGETLGNGVQLIAGNNSRLSLTSLQYKTTAQTLWSKQYTWAANAMNLTNVTDTLNSAQSYTYGYDPDNRITSASASGVAESYTIDPWGNMKQSGNYNFTQNFSTNNQISATGYTYDAAGELTADGNGNSYAYNADGMITASSGAQYVYDALDQRVEKTGGSNPTETVYFGGVPVALLNPSSGAWTDLIYAGSSMIAEVAGTQTAVPVYRLLDHLGSLAVQTNNSGTVTGSNVFLPFGELLSSTTTDSFQFTGLPQDTENSSDHAWFRNFSYQQGRWMSPDPYNGSYDIADPQSFNRYAYVENNPLAFTDPSGLYVAECYLLSGLGALACYQHVWGGGIPNQGAGGGDGEFWTPGGNTYIELGEPPSAITGSGYTYTMSAGVTDIMIPPMIVNILPFEYTPEGTSNASSGTAPNNPAPKNPTTPKSQCLAQVQANAQTNRNIIEAAGGLTLENTTAACLFAGPGAPECIAVVDPIILINTGLILAGEWYNTSQEEAACTQ